ncbi:MAG TPA: dihydrofolate reductase family protein [Ktedonobacterales bacterium]|nr:dihydrofolate reductase family protein [Ktedonobacterales bacterium]
MADDFIMSQGKNALMDTLTTLFDDAPQPAEANGLPAELRAIYGGELAISGRAASNRPIIIANFVQSLDGVISFEIAGHDTGGDISGHSEIDHAVMGILRAEADAVLWGSSNYMVSRRFVPTPEAIWKPGTAYYQDLRKSLGKPPHPLAVVVTASGNIDTSGALLRQPEQPALVVTTASGAARLGDLADAPNTTMRVVPGDGGVPPQAVASILAQEFGVGTLLVEGGARIFGAFLAAGLMDEVFLTIAPQFAGRADQAPRPGLIEGVAFAPATAPWARLLSLKRGESHLFARYAVVGPR